MVLENWTSACKRIKLDTVLNTSFIKLDLKWITYLKVRAKNWKFLEENVAIKLCGFEVGNGFLGMTLKVQVKKEKISKLVFDKTKNFCTAKDT